MSCPKLKLPEWSRPGGFVLEVVSFQASLAKCATLRQSE